MKFVNITSMTEGGLNKKVNRFRTKSKYRSLKI